MTLQFLLVKQGLLQLLRQKLLALDLLFVERFRGEVVCLLRGLVGHEVVLIHPLGDSNLSLGVLGSGACVLSSAGSFLGNPILQASRVKVLVLLYLFYLYEPPLKSYRTLRLSLIHI